MNAERVQSSVLVDLKDPVQVHLLTETALLDSKEYEILSQEEVDDLKRLVQNLNQRIESIRANLAIQSKYRDAAISMSKLYSPSGAKRKSLRGNRDNGGSQEAREAELERETIQRKCEDLATELWSLEQRLMEPQRRLLEHTAGILQLTHKTSKKGHTSTPKAAMVNGVPASPESMYTSNWRDSIEPPDDILFFDESSLYRSFDEMGLGGTQSGQANFEIPVKSPMRDQTKQLTEESDKLREEIAQLKQQASGTEEKLGTLNNHLREIILSTDSAKNGDYMAPPSGQLEPGELIGSHLEYLEKALVVVGDSQSNADDSKLLGGMYNLNIQVQDLLLLNGNPSHPAPPDASAAFDEQAAYLQDSLKAVDSQLQRASNLASSSSETKQRGDQIEAVLMGLWDIIQAGEADIRQRREDLKQSRLERGLQPEEEDSSDRELIDPSEKYSLGAFSTKVQWLYTQATTLKEQKDVLQRQIKQQRELNNKTDGEKDAVIREKEKELEQTREMLNQAENELDELRPHLDKVLSDLEKERAVQMRNVSANETFMLDAKVQVEERNAQIAQLNTQLKETTSKATQLEAELKQVNDAKTVADREVEERTKETKAKHEELEEMTSMLAQLKMEATLAKAELDGAYGSRRERAAEVAALANTSEQSKLQARVNELQPKVDQLEEELRGAVKDLKEVTKQGIDAESKIAELESELDQVMLTAHKEKEELQDQLDNARLGGDLGGPLSPGGRGNTSILTNSYREALRAERKKHDEILRVGHKFLSLPLLQY